MILFDQTFFILLTSGLLIGVLSSLFGIGGGILIIPVLQWLYPEMSPQEWVGTSFGVILTAALSNSYLFYRHKFELHMKIIRWLSLGLCLGIVAGQQLVFSLPKETFSLIFALTLIALGSKRLRGNPKRVEPGNFPIFMHVLVGVFIGALSGLIGIGGGSLILPYLMIATPIPARSLSYHSNLAMIVASIIGVAHMALKPLPLNPELIALTPFPQMTTGHVHWDLVMIFFLGILITARPTLALTKRLPAALMDRLFAALLFAIGLKFLLEVF